VGLGDRNGSGDQFKIANSEESGTTRHSEDDGDVNRSAGEEPGSNSESEGDEDTTVVIFFASFSKSSC